MLKAISYKSRFSLTKKQASRKGELVKLVQCETISADFGFHGQSFWLPGSLKSPLQQVPTAAKSETMLNGEESITKRNGSGARAPQDRCFRRINRETEGVYR